MRAALGGRRRIKKAASEFAFSSSNGWRPQGRRLGGRDCCPRLRGVVVVGDRAHARDRRPRGSARPPRRQDAARRGHRRSQHPGGRPGQESPPDLRQCEADAGAQAPGRHRNGRRGRANSFLPNQIVFQTEPLEEKTGGSVTGVHGRARAGRDEQHRSLSGGTGPLWVMR